MRWKQYPRAVLLALLVVHVLAHIDRNMLLGFSPQITADLALSNAQYGLLTGAVWVLSFGAMALFMGSLADRFSRTKVMAAGILIWSVCTAASGAAQNFEQMVLARFFVASGEAALVPAAVSLLMDLFEPERRGTAAGVFFMGIPLGIGLAFVLAGTLGSIHGWRDTFMLLGVIGVVVALPLLVLKDRRDANDGSTPAADEATRGAPFLNQLRETLETLRANPQVVWTIVGFVLVHMVFAGLAFNQLWMVRERGFDASSIARQMGLLQIVFGVLGAAVGGMLSDRLAQRLPGGHAGFLVLLVALCGPLMIAFRFAPAGSLLFYIGMCAGFFLPLATYGPALALIQGRTPARMRATVTGVTMLAINIVAIAIGNAAAGAASDHLAALGSTHALTTVLLATDVLAISAALFFVLAARGPRLELSAGAVIAH
ncbi:MAG: MFS transporter [Burkholderiaceae bacterium]|nr:MFS transporter [Burkholderiaceae bacterium]